MALTGEQCVKFQELKLLSVYFENNLLLFVVGISFAIIFWVLSKRIENHRLRRAVRATILLLVCPIFYLGHPFLYYQSWMMIVCAIGDFDIKPLAIFLCAWAVFVALSQINIKK